jgi:site-specific recombinase XerD
VPRDHLPRQVQIAAPPLILSPLAQAFEDFLLSRRAMRCTPGTLQHYRFSAGKFVEWLARHGVTDAPSIAPAHVREWPAEDADRLKDTSLHARARGVRTFVRFLHAEGFSPAFITFAMPRLERRRLPCLDPDGLKRVISVCRTPRERTLLLVRRGKGGKARLAVVGAKTLRALLTYRRTLRQPPTDDSPLFRDRRGVDSRATRLPRPLSVSAPARAFVSVRMRCGAPSPSCRSGRGATSLACNGSWVTRTWR